MSDPNPQAPESAIRRYTADLDAIAARLRTLKDPATISKLIEDAVGDSEVLTVKLVEAFDEDWEKMFRAWFTGRPSYDPGNWFTILFVLIKFFPDLFAEPSKP